MFSSIFNQGRFLKVEVAETSFSHARGLMFRKRIPEDSGMLFKFRSPQKLKFWGLNTFMPLDIAFVSSDNKITKISKINPLSISLVSSDIDCLMAIECNFNFFSKNKILTGNKINIIKKDIDTFVIFEKERGKK